MPIDLTVIMTDQSTRMLATAKQNVGSPPCRFDFSAADAVAVPFRPASFDVALAHFTIYHAADKHRGVSELN